MDLLFWWVFLFNNNALFFDPAALIGVDSALFHPSLKFARLLLCIPMDVLSSEST
jgi:hypothetical protein